MGKYLKVLFLILVLSLFIVSCSNKEILPIKLTLEDSIKEIILSKGENYDFLKDDIYTEHMGNLAYDLTNSDPSLSIKYTIGNLDEDNIPELVIFKERDPNNTNDEGSLEVYGFNGEKYTLLDKINMSFDNSNYAMKIGQISENQKGLLLNNSVGAHSGLTYGFILENGKLKSILDHKKTSLISIYTENEIRDINNDGILEFSIITIDPETEDTSVENADKMTLWYKWNGINSVNLVNVERKDYSNENSNEEIFNEAKNLISKDISSFIGFLMENKDELSKYDNSALIKDYIEKIIQLSFKRGIEINNLFFQYEKKQNINYVSEKYGIDINNLNSLEYLNREKVLKDEDEIKKHLIKNINLGFKLSFQDGIYYYLIDYDKFIDLFSENMLNEYADYLKILSFNSNETFMNDVNLLISRDELIERILLIESFKMIYPYSDFLPQTNDLYSQYVNIYFFGDSTNPNFDTNTKIMKEEFLQEFKKSAKNYEFTTFGYIINEFLTWLEENNNIVDSKIRKKLNNRLN